MGLIYEYNLLILRYTFRINGDTDKWGINGDTSVILDKWGINGDTSVILHNFMLWYFLWPTRFTESPLHIVPLDHLRSPFLGTIGRTFLQGATDLFIRACVIPFVYHSQVVVRQING